MNFSIRQLVSPAHIVAIQKLTQAGTGLITALLVTLFLSPDEQGYFYTMGSLLSSYTLLDLGLSNLLVQISARHFTKLQWSPSGEISPSGSEKAKFLGLAHQTFRWYLFASAATVILIPLGFLYFHYAHNSTQINWQWPWIAAIFCLSFSMLGIGFMALIEGSHKIWEVYSLRTANYFIGAVLAWILLYAGYGLFALAMPPFAIFVVLIFWIHKKYLPFVRSIFIERHPSNWKKEVWPLQRKVAISWLSNYLFLQIPTPLIFYFIGPKVAGQFGLSMIIANITGSIGVSWVISIIPKFTHLIEEKKFKEAHLLFMKKLWTSVVVVTLTIGVFILAAFYFEDTHVFRRILPPLEFGVLLISLALFHLANSLSTYFRAYRMEPLSNINILSTIILMCSITYLIQFGLLKALLGILLYCILFFSCSMRLSKKYACGIKSNS